MVNEQVMMTLCSAVGCGIAIVVLSLFVALARKVAAHHKHKAEVKSEASKQEDAPKEKEDDKKCRKYCGTPRKRTKKQKILNRLILIRKAKARTQTNSLMFPCSENKAP